MAPWLRRPRLDACDRMTAMLRTQRIESLSRFFCDSAKLLGLLVDLVGIEPTTSSMPWNESNRKIQTAQHLRVG